MSGTPKLFIISGPSGSGKSTVVEQLMLRCPMKMVRSISATTRPRRGEEQDGVHYFFLNDVEFQRRRLDDEFLECKEVFGRGYWYGTLRSQVTAGWNEGASVILEIDVEGAMAVLDRMPEATTIFLHPGSLGELERRLRGRNTDDNDSIQRRLEVAHRELEYLEKYDHEVINQSVDQAVEEICRIMQQTVMSTNS